MFTPMQNSTLASKLAACHFLLIVIHGTDANFDIDVEVCSLKKLSSNYFSLFDTAYEDVNRYSSP